MFFKKEQILNCEALVETRKFRVQPNITRTLTSNHTHFFHWEASSCDQQAKTIHTYKHRSSLESKQVTSHNSKSEGKSQTTITAHETVKRKQQQAHTNRVSERENCSRQEVIGRRWKPCLLQLQPFQTRTRPPAKPSRIVVL